VPAAAADSPEEQLAAASALFEAKRYANAAQRLEQFLNGSPPQSKVGVAAFTLGRCYSELDQWAKAIPAYERAIASRDQNIAPMAQLGLSEAAMESQQWDKASAALDQVVKSSLKPDQAPIVWFWRGQARFHLQKYPEAEESYAKVIQDYPKSDVADGAYFGAGLAALRQNKKDVARQRLTMLVDRFPDSQDRPQALLTLAGLEFEAKRYKEARDRYAALLKDSGKDKELERAAEEGIVRSLLELQDYPGAAARLQSLVQKLPADDPQRARALLTLGNCQYRGKQYDQALLSYRQAARAEDDAVAGDAQ
jgi:TolA-binding protein